MRWIDLIFLLANGKEATRFGPQKGKWLPLDETKRSLAEDLYTVLARARPTRLLDTLKEPIIKSEGRGRARSAPRNALGPH